MGVLRWLLLGFLVPLAAASACGGDDEEEQVEQEVEQQMPSERMGPAGCYIPAEFRCDCELTEAACTEDVGMWVDMGCGTCAS